MKHRGVSRLLFALLGLVIITLAATQAERFIRQGTLLGYTLRPVKSQQTTNNDNTPSRLATAKATKDVDQHSVACDTVSAAQVGNLLKGKFERQPNFLSDRKAPNLFSTCSYSMQVKAGQITRNVTLTVREFATPVAAGQILSNLQRTSSTVAIKGVGEEAYYAATSNQLLARKGKRVASVIISKPQPGQPDSKEASIAIAALAIK